LSLNEVGASSVYTVEVMNLKENELNGTQPVEGTRKMVNAYILVVKSRHRWETAQMCIKQYGDRMRIVFIWLQMSF